MTPYEREFIVTVDDETVQYPLNFPGRCLLERLAIAKVDAAGSTDVVVHNRSLLGTAIDIVRITESSDGTTEFLLDGQLLVKPGDTLSVADSSVVGYNGTRNHRVVAVLDDMRRIITDVSHSADAGAVGTVSLDIDPTTEGQLYKVTEITDSTNFTEVALNVSYVNLDPLPNLNIGVKRRIYLTFEAQGVFKVIIRGRESIGMGG